MNKERIVGIDFGTSTTVVRVKNYDENGKPIGDELFAQPVTFNHGASMVPSVIRRVNDSYAYGYEAEVASRNAEYFRSFKLGLQSKNEAERNQVKQLIGQFFKYIYNEYNHQLITGNLGDTNCDTKTYVSYPVKWDPDLERFMVEVAEEAGFENVSGMDEAQAAIRAITIQCKELIEKSGLLENGKSSNVMLIDMGAGTTDIVICKYTPGDNMRNEIITTWPKGGSILFGGQEVDVILRDFLVSRFPEEYREAVKKRLSVDKMKAWKENIVSETLKSNKTISDSYEAYDVADRFDIEYEPFELNRDTFEELFKDYISQFAELVGGAVRDSGLLPEDIDLVILTGGHSKWYFAEDLILDRNKRFDALGLEKIKAQPERILSVALPQETVALGLVYSKISGAISFDKGKHLVEVYENQRSMSALKEAALYENPKAINELGYHYGTGTGGIEKDTKKAFELYSKAANMGYIISWYNLGCLHFANKEYKNAAGAFAKAAEFDISEAVYNLGICYHYGLGVEKNTEKAVELYKRAYELGYLSAEAVLDKMTKSEAKTDFQTHPYDPLWYAKTIWKQLPKEQKLNWVSIGEDIPQFKLDRFYAARNYVGTPLCFYDDTFITRDYKYGFLLTDKALYYNTKYQPQGIIYVKDIAKFEFEASLLKSSIHVYTTDSRYFKLTLGTPASLVGYLTKLVKYINEKAVAQEG